MTTKDDFRGILGYLASDHPKYVNCQVFKSIEDGSTVTIFTILYRIDIIIQAQLNAASKNALSFSLPVTFK